MVRSGHKGRDIWEWKFISVCLALSQEERVSEPDSSKISHLEKHLLCFIYFLNPLAFFSYCVIKTAFSKVINNLISTPIRCFCLSSMCLLSLCPPVSIKLSWSLPPFSSPSVSLGFFQIFFYTYNLKNW